MIIFSGDARPIRASPLYYERNLNYTNCSIWMNFDEEVINRYLHIEFRYIIQSVYHPVGTTSPLPLTLVLEKSLGIKVRQSTLFICH